MLSDTELLRKVMKVINCICVELKLESTEEFLKHENAKQKIKIVWEAWQKEEKKEQKN